jgi:hypothetical protein
MKDPELKEAMDKYMAVTKEIQSSINKDKEECKRKHNEEN